MLFATMLEYPATPVAMDVRWEEILAPVLGSFVPLVVIGAVGAALPAWLGGAVMARASAGNVGLRHPACWAIAGGAMVAMPVAALGEDSFQYTGLALIATGAICALLVRYGTRWSDDSA